MNNIGIRNKELGIRNYKILLVLLSLTFFAAACNKKNTLIIGGHVLNIQVADTQAARTQGLSGRDSLAENDAMLFVFSNPDKYGFWMKDMKFPLDFIWVRNAKVVEITPNVPVLPLQTYVPNEDIDSVVEVNAGWSEKNKIKVGDSVMLTP